MARQPSSMPSCWHSSSLFAWCRFRLSGPILRRRSLTWETPWAASCLHPDKRLERLIGRDESEPVAIDNEPRLALFLFPNGHLPVTEGIPVRIANLVVTHDATGWTSVSSCQSRSRAVFFPIAL